jgi:secondary thiamine-phosphate synthase enzyme
MSVRLHDVRRLSTGFMASATLSVETRPRAFVEITREVERFIREIAAEDGIVLAYLRHTSASLVIQENADADVRSDLTRALDRLAPEDAGWVHDSEGPDDMPSHVKAMLTNVSLCAGRRRGARARYMAGHLSRRASRPSPRPRGSAAFHRYAESLGSICAALTANERSGTLDCGGTLF